MSPYIIINNIDRYSLSFWNLSNAEAKSKMLNNIYFTKLLRIYKIDVSFCSYIWISRTTTATLKTIESTTPSSPKLLPASLPSTNSTSSSLRMFENWVIHNFSNRFLNFDFLSAGDCFYFYIVLKISRLIWRTDKDILGLCFSCQGGKLIVSNLFKIKFYAGFQRFKYFGINMEL